MQIYSTLCMGIC